MSNVSPSVENPSDDGTEAITNSLQPAGDNTALIIGISVGVVVVLLLIGLAIFFVGRWSASKGAASDGDVPLESSAPVDHTAAYGRTSFVNKEGELHST